MSYLAPVSRITRATRNTMLSPNRRRLGGFVFALAFPASAGAQTAVHSFEELQRMLKVRQIVVVTDESGREVKGRVVARGAAPSPTHIKEIRIPDPLWNGILIGAAIAAGLATWDYMIDPSEPGNAGTGWRERGRIKQ